MYENQVYQKVQQEILGVLGQFVGKTVSAIVLTLDDVKDGRATIQFTDGTSLTVTADCHEECSPWLTCRKEGIPGFQQGARPAPAVDDDYIGASTEAAPFLPVTRQIHPLMKSLLDGVPVEGTREEVLDASDPADDEIFEPVDEEEMDFQDYDDETLDKMGR